MCFEPLKWLVGFKGLMVPNVRWLSQISDGAKSTHMKKVFSQKPSSVSVSSESCQSSVNNLSVPVDECKITQSI